MSTAAIAAEARLDAFLERHCICKTCAHVTERHLNNGEVTCKHPEGALIDGIPHSESSCCECHEFADPKLADKKDALMDDWYAKAEAAGFFAPSRSHIVKHMAKGSVVPPKAPGTKRNPTVKS